MRHLWAGYASLRRIYASRKMPPSNFCVVRYERSKSASALHDAGSTIKSCCLTKWMLLSDGRIAKFQSRSRIVQSTRAFAPFVPHCAKVRRRHFTRSVNAAKRSVACSEMTHYLNFVQTTLSGYQLSNLACKNIDLGVRALPAWERRLGARLRWRKEKFAF